jgi:hypothetical protein
MEPKSALLPRVHSIAASDAMQLVVSCQLSGGTYEATGFSETLLLFYHSQKPP